MNSKTDGMLIPYVPVALLVALLVYQMTFSTYLNYMVLCQLEQLISAHYNSYVYHVGTVNLKKNLDIDAWCYSYLNYARQAEPFYPEEFYNAAEAILQTDLRLNPRDITLENAESVYQH